MNHSAYQSFLDLVQRKIDSLKELKANPQPTPAQVKLISVLEAEIPVLVGVNDEYLHPLLRDTTRFVGTPFFMQDETHKSKCNGKCIFMAFCTSCNYAYSPLIPQPLYEYAAFLSAAE